ncbi:phosphatase PAP2 family protein [Paenibacillus alba]|nr:phosphatase PAP2 family protein [Paenibacillus alba]
MKIKFAAYLPLLWILAIPVLNVFYGILNHGRGGNVGSLMTDLDRLIPFVPAFIIPYLIWYPFIFVMLVVFFMKNRAVYYRSLTTLCTGLLACYLVYALYQTTVPRPGVEPNGLFNGLVNIVYRTDAPFNCFPSIHVLTSYVVLKASYLCGIKRSTLSVVFITVWSIIVSTLFVKQHALLDIAGAVLLAEALYFVVKRFRFAGKHTRKETAVHEL